MPYRPQSGYRKRRKTKGRAPRVTKTSRHEHPPTFRAFITSAIEHGATELQLHKETGAARSTIHKIAARARERADAAGLPIWDKYVYEDDAIAQGREPLLNEEDKQRLRDVVVQDREHRYMPAHTLLQASIWDQAGIPRLSRSTLQNAMYEGFLAKRKPGWKFHLTPAMKEARFQWALLYNPDPTPSQPAFDWISVIFTDETPAKVGLVAGKFYAWCKADEVYSNDVKRTRPTKYLELQFWACFMYGAKGPCHVHFKETPEEAQQAAKDLNQRNQARQHRYRLRSHLVSQARRALHVMNEPAVNAVGRRLPYNQVKKLDMEQPLKRGDRQRGGVDGYRHEQLVLLPKLLPFVRSQQEAGRQVVVLEDGAPAHNSQFDREFFVFNDLVKILWPGNSPDINASEHAWPWMRRQITKQGPPSTTKEQCAQQWRDQWQELPIEVINQWVLRIPNKIREIIKQHGDNSFKG